MTWPDYHEATKHTVERLRRKMHVLDWANMPDPFRHYEGVPVLDLPSDPPTPGISALEVLAGTTGPSQALDGASFLSELLFYSAAISATKRVPSTGYRYALRVNPSSGNLHPTEFHFLTRGLSGWPDGLYHYRPSSHMAEQRAAGPIKLPGCDSSASVVFVLTSIAWREAWKYGDRAYRYCLHDIGHAWQALALAARAMGCGTLARGHFPDDETALACRLAEDEWPMLMIELQGTATPIGVATVTETVWYGGEPNRLSQDTIAFPRIQAIHSSTQLQGDKAVSEPAKTGSGQVSLPDPACSAALYGKIARARRSALDFIGGTRNISLPQLSALLKAAAGALDADFGDGQFIQLFLYVHRVDGLEPGVYRFWNQRSELELIRLGDHRVVAAGLSLGQDLAGNACVALSMIGDLPRAVRAYGDRGYRYVHFEAGAIGQRLYLAAEALGLGATGIGAFFDDRVHSYLNLATNEGQVVYHFAIGYPVPDPRLES